MTTKFIAKQLVLLILSKMNAYSERTQVMIKNAIIALNVILLLYLIRQEINVTYSLNYREKKYDDMEMNEVIPVFRVYYSVCVFGLCVVYVNGIVGTLNKSYWQIVSNVVILSVTMMITLLCLFGPLFDELSISAVVWVLANLALITLNSLFLQELKNMERQTSLLPLNTPDDMRKAPTFENQKQI